VFDSEGIGGAQFDLVGATLEGASGGTAEDVGWTVSTSSTTWLGFSFSGATVPAGSGVLTVLEFSGAGDELCLDNGVLSDNTGNTIELTLGDCITPEPVYGCTDDGACNYDPGANTDCDDCCEYPENDCTDCDGDDIGGWDCAGVCGGDAEEDCSGECNGDAAFDECGVCEGPGPDYECFDGSFACDASGCIDGAILSFGGLSGNSVQVLYSSSEGIGGFLLYSFHLS
jgi:hypothetical protein